jgi:hypothetical protein
VTERKRFASIFCGDWACGPTEVHLVLRVFMALLADGCRPAMLVKDARTATSDGSHV